MPFPFLYPVSSFAMEDFLETLTAFNEQFGLYESPMSVFGWTRDAHQFVSARPVSELVSLMQSGWSLYLPFTTAIPEYSDDIRVPEMTEAGMVVAGYRVQRDTYAALTACDFVDEDKQSGERNMPVGMGDNFGFVVSCQERQYVMHPACKTWPGWKEFPLIRRLQSGGYFENEMTAFVSAFHSV